MTEFLNEIILHLSDIGLIGDPCKLPLERISTKERLAETIAAFYCKLSRNQLRDIFLATINQIETFLLSKAAPAAPRPSPEKKAHSPKPKSDTFNRLYNHHFEKLKLLEYKKKLSEHEPECTFVPAINRDRFYQKVCSPFHDRNAQFIQKKKVTEVKAKLSRDFTPPQCTFQPRINQARAVELQLQRSRTGSFDKENDTCLEDTREVQGRQLMEERSKELRKRLNHMLQDTDLPPTLRINSFI